MSSGAQGSRKEEENKKERYTGILYIRERRVLRTLSRLHPLTEFNREPFAAVQCPHRFAPRYTTDKRSFVTKEIFIDCPADYASPVISIFTVHFETRAVQNGHKLRLMLLSRAFISATR